MKYLLLAALVVTGSAHAGTKQEERRAANWCAGVGGMAIVNQDLGNQTIKKALKAPKERTLEDLKRDNPQGYNWVVGVGIRGRLLSKKASQV